MEGMEGNEGTIWRVERCIESGLTYTERHVHTVLTIA